MKAIQAETETRQDEDDEIIGALQDFSKKLQQSLKVVNSMEKD